MSQQKSHGSLRARALWIAYTAVVFCGLLLAPLDAALNDLPPTWKAASLVGLIVSLPISLIWVLIASYDPAEVIPSASIIIAFHLIGSAVFTLIQITVIRTGWKLARRRRRSRTKPSHVSDG